MYFDQQTGASHTVCWLKSSWFSILTSFSFSNQKLQEKKCINRKIHKKGSPELRCYSQTLTDTQILVDSWENTILQDEIKKNATFPRSQPAFGCQPAFSSSIWTLADTLLLMYFKDIFMYFYRLLLIFWWGNMLKCQKDDFDQQTGCKGPVHLLKYTTNLVKHKEIK